MAQTNITNSSLLQLQLQPNHPSQTNTNFLTLSQLSNTLLSIVEAMAIAFCDHNNKENISPFSAKQANLSNPVTENGSSAKKCKLIRLRRKPLADITNLYQYNNNSLQSAIQFIPSSASNSRKRKAIDQEVNTIQATSSNSKSRSLRMGFR